MCLGSGRGALAAAMLACRHHPTASPLKAIGLGRAKGERQAWVKLGCPMEGEKLLTLYRQLTKPALADAHSLAAAVAASSSGD